MKTDAKTARKIGALYFDEETILEVKQLGGGGSGVGGANGLNARNLVTGEDTGETIAEQAEEIEQQAGQIETLTAANEELSAANEELTEQLANAYIVTPYSLTVENNSSAEYAIGVGQSFGNAGTLSSPYVCTPVKVEANQQTRVGAKSFVRKPGQTVLELYLTWPGPATNKLHISKTSGTDKFNVDYNANLPAIIITITDETIANIGLTITIDA